MSELLPVQDERVDADCPCACHTLGVADTCLSVCCVLARNAKEIAALRVQLAEVQASYERVREEKWEAACLRTGHVATEARNTVEAARTFLACHDAFMLRQDRATAYAMKDAADSLRTLIASLRDKEGA